MGIVLALLSAFTFGVSDYVGARASRHTSAAAITSVSEAINLLILLVVLPLIEPAGPTWRAVYGGLLGGVFGVMAVFGLYYALAQGSMSVVAPITAVVAAVLPVVVGILLGERPSTQAYVGIVLAVLAVALVGGITGLSHTRIALPMIGLAVAVGAGFGLMFITYFQTGAQAGLWPLLFARLIGLPMMLTFVAFQRRNGTLTRLSWRRLAPGVLVGVMIAAANMSYLIASRTTLLSIVVVIVAMYPAATVALAIVIDREPVSRPQVVGMGLAALAVGLIALA